MKLIELYSGLNKVVLVELIWVLEYLWLGYLGIWLLFCKLFWMTRMSYSLVKVMGESHGILRMGGGKDR